MAHPFLSRFPLAHTFSIVARDPETGEMGAAVQSHWFSVGSIVIWGEAGVGVVATQALAEASYGPLGLDLMRAGRPAPQALRALLVGDDHPEVRQVAMLDASGRVSVHTGAHCIQYAGHEVVVGGESGPQFSVQANMMASAAVWGAMADGFRAASGALADRLMAALLAGQAAGGDIRGQQSAAMLVVAPESTGKPWEDTRVSLRVEDHPQPLAELGRLLTVHKAYQYMNQGDTHLGSGQIDAALEAYRSAAELAPDILEMPFWHANTLLDLHRAEEAVPIFRRVFSGNPDWAVLLRRLPEAGMLNADAETIEKTIQAAMNEGAAG